MCALGKGWEESEQGRKRGIEESRVLIKVQLGRKNMGKNDLMRQTIDSTRA